MSIWPSFKEQRTFAWLLTALMSLTVILIVVAAISLLNINREINYYENTITVEGEALIEQAPNKATIYFSVGTKNESAEEAQSENDEIMTEILDSLSEILSEDDIQTQDYNLYQDQRWNPDTRRYEDGDWMVEQRIHLSIDDIDSAGAILGLLGEGGASNISGPDYEADEDADMEDAARLEAIAEAIAEAESIAEALDKSLGRMIDYTEYSYGDDDYFYDYGIGGGDRVYAESTSIEIAPGTEETTFYVSITYKLR